MNDEIEIPKELYLNNPQVDLCIDVMYVEKMAFLTAIDKTIRYRSSVYLENNKGDKLFRGIDQILRLYNKGNFRVRKIHCDNEFKKILDEVSDGMDVTVVPAPAQTHQSKAERNNRTIKGCAYVPC